MTSTPETLVVRPSGPATIDELSVVALDAVGAIVGRATLSRLYGARGELQIEVARTGTVVLALIDALELAARERGLTQLELNPSKTAGRLVAALRGARPTRDEQRGTDLRVTWPTTPFIP